MNSQSPFVVYSKEQPSRLMLKGWEEVQRWKLWIIQYKNRRYLRWEPQSQIHFNPEQTTTCSMNPRKRPSGERKRKLFSLYVWSGSKWYAAHLPVGPRRQLTLIGNNLHCSYHWAKWCSLHHYWIQTSILARLPRWSFSRIQPAPVLMANRSSILYSS